jgi:hypothetical protein
LAPEKSFWYMLEDIWKKGKRKFACTTQCPGTLYLNNGTVKNQRLEPDQAKKALGIMMHPDGNMKEEIQLLKQAASKWCNGLQTKRIHPEEAWYSFKATILRSLEYPLVATTFTQKQCKAILRPVLRAALPLSGVQRRLPSALVHGSMRSRGLDISDLSGPN